ncbi:MAG: hypothetical protein H6Q48_3201, partial [Deltaproteobacteria bacterium]|nr:hypothetical protein [Deltaproteobacteria bacterium]
MEHLCGFMNTADPGRRRPMM